MTTPPVSCLALLARGDGEGYRLLMERHGRALNALAKRFRNVLDHDDAISEMVMAIMRGAYTYDPARGAAESTWLYTVGHNRLRSLAKRERLRRHAPLIEREAARAEERPETAAAVRVLEELTAAEADLVRLAARGCTLEAMSAVVGVPVGTVKSRLYRARERAAAMLEPVPTHDTDTPKGPERRCINCGQSKPDNRFPRASGNRCSVCVITGRSRKAARAAVVAAACVLAGCNERPLAAGCSDYPSRSTPSICAKAQAAR